MKSCVVSISEVARDPTHNLSAKYWCDKKKEAQKKEQDNNFSEVLEEEMRKLGSNNE